MQPPERFIPDRERLALQPGGQDSSPEPDVAGLTRHGIWHVFVPGDHDVARG